jgi:Beta-galactosidase trimerisation domain/Polysaccharide deacetylase
MMLHIKRLGWILAGFFLLLFAGTAIYLGYETCWLGTVSLNPLPSDAAVLTAPGSDFRVAILRGEYTSAYLKKPANYYAHVDYWQKLALGMHMPVDLIGDSQLEAGIQGVKVLILPSALCLSQKEKNSIRDFVSKGGGVISTWATGARDETGAWKGLDFLSHLTGADSFDFSERASPWYISFLSGNPITAGAPGGSRIQVDSPERLQAKSIIVDGYWSDSRLFPVDPNLPVIFQGAVVHNTANPGRVAWFGFQENAAVAEGNNKSVLDLALKNSLAWTGQETICALNFWPAPYLSATVFGCDVEESYFNASYSASALRKLKERGTFFCLSELVKEDADLIPQLKGAGEVASHGDTHTAFGKAGILSQFIRVAKSKWRLGRLGGSMVAGFHPPSDDFSDTTLKAVAAAHYKYILIGGENSTGAASVLPDIVRVSQSMKWFHRDMDLVKLTRTMDDDLHYSPLGIVGLSQPMIIQRAVSDFQIIHGLGGLYVFSFHSQGFGSPEFAGIFPPIVDQLHQSGTWITTGEDVAQWWALRSHLSVDISELGIRGILLTVKSNDGAPPENAALTVYPPSGIVAAHVVPASGPQISAEVIPNSDTSGLTLNLGKLNPGMTYRFDLLWGQ